jgi:hypothetical protein
MQNYMPTTLVDKMRSLRKLVEERKAVLAKMPSHQELAKYIKGHSEIVWLPSTPHLSFILGLARNFKEESLAELDRWTQVPYYLPPCVLLGDLRSQTKTKVGAMFWSGPRVTLLDPGHQGI